MSELEYTPTLAFPFLLLFKGDDLSAFEATLSVFLHWQHGFLSTFPSPPITLLSTVEQVPPPSLPSQPLSPHPSRQKTSILLIPPPFSPILPPSHLNPFP